MAADILQLPVASPPLCGDCENAALSSSGVRCLVFSELIWDEREAETCDAFERSE